MTLKELSTDHHNPRSRALGPESPLPLGDRENAGRGGVNSASRQRSATITGAVAAVAAVAATGPAAAASTGAVNTRSAKAQ